MVRSYLNIIRNLSKVTFQRVYPNLTDDNSCYTSWFLINNEGKMQLHAVKNVIVKRDQQCQINCVLLEWNLYENRYVQVNMTLQQKQVKWCHDVCTLHGDHF